MLGALRTRRQDVRHGDIFRTGERQVRCPTDCPGRQQCRAPIRRTRAVSGHPPGSRRSRRISTCRWKTSQPSTCKRVPTPGSSSGMSLSIPARFREWKSSQRSPISLPPLRNNPKSRRDSAVFATAPHRCCRHSTQLGVGYLNEHQGSELPKRPWRLKFRFPHEVPIEGHYQNMYVSPLQYVTSVGYFRPGGFPSLQREDFESSEAEPHADPVLQIAPQAGGRQRHERALRRRARRICHGRGARQAQGRRHSIE